MAKLKDLEVDRRVGIAMSVLPPSQRNAVQRVIDSPQSFAQATRRPGSVRHLHTSGQPLYLMRVSPKLRLVYTMVGETPYVVDLVEGATLARFAHRKSGKVAKKAKVAKKPKGVAKKADTP